MDHQVEITEAQRQMVLLALSELSFARPGWVLPIEDIAARIPGGEALLFEYQRRRALGLLEGIEIERPENMADLRQERDGWRALALEWLNKCRCRESAMQALRKATAQQAAAPLAAAGGRAP